MRLVGPVPTLPLANFGSVTFARSAATDGTHPGTIIDPAWSTTSIELSERPVGAGAGFVGQPSTNSGAAPSDLSADGRAFSVTWQPASAG